MQEQISLNASVREAITEALLRLMGQKPFEQITITEICRLAGVCRSSFYRNFPSREAILLEYMQAMYRDFFLSGEVPHARAAGEDPAAFIMPRFMFIKNHRDFFTILNAHGLLYRAFEQMNADLMQKISGTDAPTNSYFRAFMSGACAGVVQHWIEDGFRASVEELVELFASVQSNFFQ
ncbi:MAG: TetR/AcrR family transcriptional regulator [Clostridia bacterium]|nr:TetR/AcrR family transcriptional regulator [Clostridia bacterium]